MAFEGITPKRVTSTSSREEGPKLPKQINMTVSEALTNEALRNDATLKNIIADWDGLQAQLNLGHATIEDAKLIDNMGVRIKNRLAQYGITLISETQGSNDVTVATFVEAYKK